jgi:hypothetical protein
MNLTRKIAAISVAAMVGLTGLEIGAELGIPGVAAISDAQARVGRPATPLSVAGVGRRTTRRVVRRTAYTVAALPAGCVYGVYYGGNYYRCGGVYYEKSGTVYVQVVFE